MRLALLALLFGAQAAHAADLPAADQSAIDEVITAQIEAFRHDDAEGAFKFASPGIQQQFGDGARFLAVVREAYKPVYRPRSFTFSLMNMDDGSIHQEVEVIGPDGVPATAIYDMQKQPDGSWRISGCHLLKAPEAAA